MHDNRSEMYEAVLESIHDRAKWETFKIRYFLELDAKQETVKNCFNQAAKGRLTLLFSARDVEYNQAVALREYLLSRFKQRGS